MRTAAAVVLVAAVAAACSGPGLSPRPFHPADAPADSPSGVDPLAIAAIRHAKFRPARIGDCPVPQEIGQAFRFNASSPTRP